jgi:hypothetical protein
MYVGVRYKGILGMRESIGFELVDFFLIMHVILVFTSFFHNSLFDTNEECPDLSVLIEGTNWNH